MSDYLDGERFVSFLERVAPDWEPTRDESSSLSRWRKGVAVSVWTADRLLTELNLHLSLLPDDMWCANPNRRPPGCSTPIKYPNELKEAIVLRVEVTGDRAVDIERETGVPQRRISEWMLKSRKRAAR